jgi:outer membrane lipoprotein-sorting protein
MVQIDARASRIDDLSADFEQKKYTPLLKKPMVSSGAVWARGSAMLWHTRQPEPTVMRVDEKEVSIYYPKQKTVEIYPIGGQLSSLAASPLPRLAALLPHFTFAVAQEEDVKEIGDLTRIPGTLALRLAPLAKDLKEHLDHVVVLIDGEHGYILAFKMVDADGEATVIRFNNPKVNSGFDDARLKLDMPANVKVVKPLENLGGGGGTKP